jgi:ribosomal protein S12 methylthiotransferase
MAGQIPEKEKTKRREQVMVAQRRIAREISKSFVGREIKVLVEGNASEIQLQQAGMVTCEHGLIRDAPDRKRRTAGRHVLVARSEADAPDIDGRVFVHGRLPIGQFAQVRVVGYTDYDLIAEPVRAGR